MNTYPIFRLDCELKELRRQINAAIPVWVGQWPTIHKRMMITRRLFVRNRRKSKARMLGFSINGMNRRSI